MEIVLALAIGVLTGSGVWLLLRPRTFQVIMGLSLLSYAVNLFIFSMGRLGLVLGQVPVLQPGLPHDLQHYADPLPQSLQPIRHGSDAAVNRLIRHMLANDGLQFAQRGIGELLLGDQHVAETLAARGDDAAGQAALALQFVNQAADRTARSHPFAVQAGIAQLIVALDQAVDGEERQGQQKHHQQPRGIAPDRRQAVLGDPWGGGLQPVV